MRPLSRPLIGLAVAALACPALAQPPPHGPPPGRVFISPSGEPFRPGQGAAQPFEVWFDRADTNHDGAINRAEFRADAQAFFKVIDANGDGRLDGFEIAAYERDIAPELIAAAEGGIHQPGEADEPHGRERGRGPHGGPEGRSRRGPLALINEPEPVSGADFDLDWKVFAAEWLRAADRRFDMLDEAKSGLLTREILTARFSPPRKKKP